MDNTEEMVTAKVRKVLHVVSEFEEGCIVYKCTITQKKKKVFEDARWYSLAVRRDTKGRRKV